MCSIRVYLFIHTFYCEKRKPNLSGFNGCRNCTFLFDVGVSVSDNNCVMLDIAATAVWLQVGRSCEQGDSVRYCVREVVWDVARREENEMQYWRREAVWYCGDCEISVYFLWTFLIILYFDLYIIKINILDISRTLYDINIDYEYLNFALT